MLVLWGEEMIPPDANVPSLLEYYVAYSAYHLPNGAATVDIRFSPDALEFLGVEILQEIWAITELSELPVEFPEDPVKAMGEVVDIRVRDIDGFHHYGCWVHMRTVRAFAEARPSDPI